MKNNFVLFRTGFFILLILWTYSVVGQSNHTEHYKTVEKENIIKEFYRIWDSAEVEAFEKVLSKDLIDHEREEKGKTSDYQNMIDATLRVHAGFSEVKHEPLQTHYVEGDKVIVYWNHTAIHTGEVGGISATNKPIRMKGVDIFQIKDGKITEIWHVEAIHQIMAQIGGGRD